MAFDFLQPLEPDFLDYIQSLSPQSLGKKTVFHTETEFPNIENVSVAIIGVLENRGSGSSNEIVNLEYIRKEFYSLFPGNWQNQIVDLGNIAKGDTIEDTYYVLKTAVATLIKNKIIPLVIGGSQDLTYAMYRAYDQLEQMVNVVSIDSKFDFERENGNPSESFLTKMIIEEPNILFNYCNIGYQTYFNPQEEIDLIEKMYFDAFRLGEIANNIGIAEPVFRDADLVSLDFNSIMSCNSANFVKFVPNGFSGKEICALARYAGISDKVTSFGIFNHNNSQAEAVLISQIMWYFIEGSNFRSNEYPFGSKQNYIKYIVTLEEDLIFYKSNTTERWWIEIPILLSSNNKLKKSTLLPCSYQDYLDACAGEVPERFWKAQRKNIV